MLKKCKRLARTHTHMHMIESERERGKDGKTEARKKIG